MIETGTILQQRYRIDRQIGQGGMGAVYIGTDERFGSTVAIKETLCMDDNFRKAIEREARLLNSLRHNALPRVSDHFEERDSQFLVMEYIPGEDVATMLEVDHAQFSPDQVLKWADQLLDALDYLHNQDIPVVHRDIKPQNLKINSRGDAVLLDFGLAKGNPTDAAHQTAAKSIFGYSRNYASLEQIQGTGTDPRSDLYSLAATLYHLLTNSAPEDALTRAMAVLSQRPDPLVPADKLNPAIPRGVAGVLQKAMDLNASARPASATEMRQMLRDYEDYGYLADDVTVALPAAQLPLAAQPTKLMPEDTRPAAALAGAFTGSTHADDASQVTSLRPGLIDQTAFASSGNTEAPPARKRGFAVAAGMLVVLLVGAAAAAGVYMVNPSLFGQTVDDAPVTVADPSAPVDQNIVATEPASQAAPSGEQAGVGTAAVPEAPAATTQNEQNAPAATGTKNQKPTAAPQRPDNVTEFTFTDEDSDLPGDTTITTRDESGRITSIKVKPVPGRTRVPATQPDGESFPSPKDFDWSKMTPLQRKKLQERILRQVVRPNIPAPPPPQPKN